MTRFVSPPRDQLHKLRQPLTPGEWEVFKFFDACLPPAWEIYLQPYLNGLRPDFILLNPHVGIAVFEVKDWNLDAMEYFIDKKDGKPILMGNKDGKKFSIQKSNPVKQIDIYKREIYELYCPRLQTKSGLAAITTGIIFPFADDEKVNQLLAPFVQRSELCRNPRYFTISGVNALQQGQLGKVFPEGVRHSSSLINEILAKDLRNWLIEPDFAATQRTPLELNTKQRDLILGRTKSGYRRIKGPAGSGKSMILAGRAAQLAIEGKEVLVITFNITLTHYLSDLAVRWPHGKINLRTQITWLNFHSWCKRVCEQADRMEEYKKLWNDHFSHQPADSNRATDEEMSEKLDRDLPDLIGTIIDEDPDQDVKRYDAILVDEGQDFLLEWWNVLRKVCKPDGEMLLVADTTQDVYGKARSWTEERMKGAGFVGDWSKLDGSYRLPPQLLDYAKQFVEIFMLPRGLAVDIPSRPTDEFDYYPCKLRWIQTNKNYDINVCIEEITNMACQVDPVILAIPDITFLASSKNSGITIVNELKNRQIKVVHTFSDNSQESQKLKHGFFMGDARVKSTTLHSFKGWESRALVVHISHAFNEQSLALIYAGLTRLKRHTEGSFLTVICSASELLEYGKGWPDYRFIDAPESTV